MERQAILEIDTNSFKRNVESIKNYLNNQEIMPIIKANGYGTYINKRLDLIKDFNIVGVAIVKEGIELRKIGFNNEIFVLNQPAIDDIDNIIKYNITVGVSSLEFIKELGMKKKEVTIHIEIETGMGRTGVNPNELDYVSELIKKYPNINVEGIYTHLSVPDVDSDFTNKQLDIFKESVNRLKDKFNFKYIHAQASTGLLNYNLDICNLYRPGIILYGYESCTNSNINLEPIAKLKAKITYIKEVDTGTSISYGRKYITDKRTKVATVGIGYADGIRRGLSNKGKVVINNRLAPIIGTICMDSFMIDVTDIPDVKEGDFVYIWDNNLIKLEDVANELNTINYEIISTISDRVERDFI